MKHLKIFLIILIVIIDQITKFLFKNKTIKITNSFYINYLENKGALFGLFQRGRFIFIIIAIILLIILFKYLIKEKNKFLQLIYIFLISGITGNLIDRIFLGYVIDFIDFKIWPIFNIADSFVTIGIILLIYFYLFKSKSNP